MDMGTGGVIYMVGPSGVGKDSLLNWLRQRVQQMAQRPPLHFAQRTITRSHESSNEEHEAVDGDAFARLHAQGVFALQWDAHGLRYGVRHTQLVQAGAWVLVNGSRAYAEQARALVPGLVVLHVSAPQAALRARLSGRGREDAGQMQARMLRASTARLEVRDGDLHLVNAVSLDESALALCAMLQARTGLQLLTDSLA